MQGKSVAPPRNEELRVERITYATAQSFFREYEHLGDCGLGVWHWGAFLQRELVGAVSFGTTCFGKCRGPLREILTEFALDIYQISRGGTVPIETASLKGFCLRIQAF